MLFIYQWKNATYIKNIVFIMIDFDQNHYTSLSILLCDNRFSLFLRINRFLGYQKFDLMCIELLKNKWTK